MDEDCGASAARVLEGQNYRAWGLELARKVSGFHLKGLALVWDFARFESGDLDEEPLDLCAARGPS